MTPTSLPETFKMTKKDPPPKTYEISSVQGNKYILCLLCNKPSFIVEDIESKRCPHCRKTHK
jgi:hypothetical protein